MCGARKRLCSFLIIKESLILMNEPSFPTFLSPGVADGGRERESGEGAEQLLHGLKPIFLHHFKTEGIVRESKQKPCCLCSQHILY